jgi:hypothetical protein
MELHRPQGSPNVQTHRFGDERAPFLRSDSEFTGLLFSELHALNREFVSLLVSEASANGNMDLPETVLHSLRLLSRPQLEALAQSPYALFDLGLEDRHCGSWSISRCRVAVDTSTYRARCDFVRTALHFAWHAARTELRLARFIVGIGDATAKQLANLSVVDVAGVASLLVGRLVARWRGNPCFWPDLVRFVSLQAEDSLQASKLLGCQLGAATWVSASQSVGTVRARALVARRQKSVPIRGML